MRNHQIVIMMILMILIRLLLLLSEAYASVTILNIILLLFICYRLTQTIVHCFYFTKVFDSVKKVHTI